MQKGVLRFFLILVGLYVGLHIALGSSPVQRRVLQEVRQALNQVGLDLAVESIEFSAFVPRIYLNRVLIKERANSPVPIAHPISIDKIKIEFQPLALISRQIWIDEAILYHPTLLVPDVQKIIRSVGALTGRKPNKLSEANLFTLVLKKVGVVDALVDANWKEEALWVRSRSLTASLETGLNRQQFIRVESNNLEGAWKNNHVALDEVDVDLEIQRRSIRVHQAKLRGEGVSLKLQGSIGLPIQEQGKLAALQAQYDLYAPLSVLKRIPNLALPDFEGSAGLAGSVKYAGGDYSGAGSLRYDGLSIDGYGIGDGDMRFKIAAGKVALSDLKLRYSGGELTSDLVNLDLSGKLPIAGVLHLNNVKLEQLLKNVRSSAEPLHMGISGDLRTEGTLSPLAIHSAITTTFDEISVAGAKGDPRIIRVPSGKVDGRLTFLPDRMGFVADAGILSGQVRAEGFVGFRHRSELDFKAVGLSLTQLGKVSELNLGGRIDMDGRLVAASGDLSIQAGLDAKETMIGAVYAGDLRGRTQFQNGLLSFEDLEIQAVPETIRGSGHLDFNGDRTQYRFTVDGKRVRTQAALNILKEFTSDVSLPSGGEVGARVTIQNAPDFEGTQVLANGTVRNFRWYDEEWLNSQYQVEYRGRTLDISRLTLLKKSGGIDVKGKVAKGKTHLQFSSHGLRVEELEHTGKAPLGGELVGKLDLDVADERAAWTGDVRWIRSQFRGREIRDSSLKLRSASGKMEAIGALFGDTLRFRWTKSATEKKPWELMLFFEEADFAAALSAWLKGDPANLDDLTATGDVSLSGVGDDFSTISGSGALSYLNVGLRGTPMRNKQPLSVKVDNGAIRVPRFSLIGRDSQVSLDINYEPTKSINAALDAKLDLQFVQPFIPSLDYGIGKLSAGVRISGNPANFTMLGNISLSDGTLRLRGLSDELRSSNAQISVSHEKLSIDKFESTVNGGKLSVEGDVRIARFKEFSPNLKLTANRIGFRPYAALSTRFSGDFSLKGPKAPYHLSGRCLLHEADLTSLTTNSEPDSKPPVLTFDVQCEGKDGLWVRSDLMESEFKGNFHILGSDVAMGMLGSVDSLRGSLIFRETRFNLQSASVKFESPNKIAPRFNVSGRALIKEAKVQQPQEYEVNIQVLGTPSDYRIRLSSNPALVEPDIISLLVLGVTGRSQEGNYLDLGTALVGQIPLRSRIQSEFGLGISLNQASRWVPQASSPTAGASTFTDVSVPSVQIQKEITNRTKVSYSNTLEAVPQKELKIEHMLNQNFTVNGTAGDRTRGVTDSQTVPAYGLDFRYRFHFE